MAIGVIPYYVGHSSLQELTVLINGNGLLVDRNYQSLFLMLCILSAAAFLRERGNNLKFLIKLGIVAIIAADIFYHFSRSIPICNFRIGDSCGHICYRKCKIHKREFQANYHSTNIIDFCL